MKLHGFWLGLLLACVGCQSSASNPSNSLSASTDSVISLMNERLGLMVEVAELKSQINLPIEDSAREEAILQAVEVDSKAAGVEKAFAREFFSAQFDAAKMVQNEAKKKFKPGKATDDEIKKAGEKLNEIRTKINDLNIKLLMALGKVDWTNKNAEARKLFAERGPGVLNAHGETVADKALAPLLPK